MSSTKHTRIPNKPILSSTTTKVVSGKVVKTGSKAATPQRAKPKKLVQQQKEVTAIHPILKNDKKESKKIYSGSETDSETARSPRNSNQNSFSSTHSNQTTPKRDSLESLKKQINDLSKFSFQQSQLIKKLHADLVRAELVTGNSDPNSSNSLTPDQFSFIGQRLHFLLENYINQTERLRNIGGIDQAEKQFNDYNERALQVEKLCQDELGPDFTIDELSEIIQSQNVKSRGVNLSDEDTLDIELGKKIRNFFDEGSENESIVSHVESLKYFVESMKAVTKIQDNDINSHIRYLKSKIRELDELKAKNEEIQRENDNLTHLLKDTQDQLLQSSNKNDADQPILNTVKSFYQNSPNTGNINQFVEQSLDLSNKVRNIFNDEDNNEAILRTIQSNKDSADDNTRVAELSSKLQQLQRNQDGIDTPETSQPDTEAIENLNRQHQQDLAKKDSEIIQLNHENSHLRNQLQNQANSIQILNQTIENNQQKLSEKESQIDNLTHENEQLRNSAPSQNYNQEVAEKESQIIQLTQENDYLKNKNQKLTNSINAATENSQREINEKDSTINRLTQENEQLRSQVNNAQNLGQTVELHQQKLAEKDSQIDRLTQENEQLRNQANNAQNLSDSHQQKLNEKDSQIDRLTQENEQLRNQANNVQNLNDSHQQKLAEKDSTIDRLTQENEQLRNQANNAQNLSQTVELHQQKLAEKDSTIDRLTQENEQLRSQANNVQNLSQTVELHQQKLAEKDSTIDRLTQENEQLRNQANNAQNLSDSHQQKLNEKDSTIDRLTHENEQLRSQAATSQNLNESQQRQLSEKDSQISRLTEENNQLRSQATDYQNLSQTVESHQQKLAEKDNTISRLTEENNQLKSEANKVHTLTSNMERSESKIADRDKQINQLTEENNYLRTQGQNQANSIRDLHITIDNIQQEIGQKNDELKEAYRRLEQEGKENESQRKDRELATRVREVFNSCAEESIVNFIKKDVELASSIRYTYQSGDDGYIITKIRGEHNENEQILAENSHLTEENTQLRNEISEKHKINEQREKENDELRKVMNNLDDVKNQEIEYLKKELLTSLDKQKELENKMTTKNNENEKLKNQISGGIESIEQKEKEINEIKATQQDEINKLKQEIEIKEQNTKQLKSQVSKQLNEMALKEKEISQLKELHENKLKQIQNEISLKDDEINKLRAENDSRINNVDLFHSVTNLFHPDLSNDEIKNHSQRIAESAQSFYNESEARPALNHLFNQASGENLRELVDKMKNDPDESVRKNAEVLSDVLKDSRMSIEAEGMITTTLAMFLQQLSNNQ